MNIANPLTPEGIWVWIAAILTLAVFSFLYRENPFYRFAEHLFVGIANGVAVGIVVGIIAYFWKGIPILGIVLGLAMIINIFVGTLIGTLIPLSLKWFKSDPALGSHIFVTAFTDAFGFFSFLGLAAIFIKLFT